MAQGLSSFVSLNNGVSIHKTLWQLPVLPVLILWTDTSSVYDSWLGKVIVRSKVEGTKTVENGDIALATMAVYSC